MEIRRSCDGMPDNGAGCLVLNFVYLVCFVVKRIEVWSEARVVVMDHPISLLRRVRYCLESSMLASMPPGMFWLVTSGSGCP